MLESARQSGFCFVFTFNGGIMYEDSILYFTKYLKQEVVGDYVMLVRTSMLLFNANYCQVLGFL